MIINRDNIKNTFAEYTDKYNSEDPKIKLKIDHTYRVADLCEKIAQSIDTDTNKCDIAWLIGMLHDVGRFEQIKRYGTFNDSESVDHANFGADLLFKDNLIEDYVPDFYSDKYAKIVETAIRSHSCFRLDESLDELVLFDPVFDEPESTLSFFPSSVFPSPGLSSSSFPSSGSVLVPPATGLKASGILTARHTTARSSPS